jgi:hypothetical protein
MWEFSDGELFQGWLEACIVIYIGECTVSLASLWYCLRCGQSGSGADSP